MYELNAKVAAIGKSQAVIELALDGSILASNPNFLSALGYALEKPEGNHHRMFCSQQETGSPSYLALWDKLRADQAASGSRQVSDSSQAISQGATEQASALEQITASMTEMPSQTKRDAENATQANQLPTDSRTGAEKGNLLMQVMV